MQGNTPHTESLFLLTLAICAGVFCIHVDYCLARQARVKLPQLEQYDNSDEVAVIAILGTDGTSLVTKAASAIHSSLSSMEKIKIMDVAEIVDRLRSDRINECDTDLNRLEGIYQQGYLQSYSFKYLKAVAIFNKVLDGLDSSISSKQRWSLWEKTKIMEGLALCGLKKESAAIHSFLSVLKTRPEMVLSKKNYSPKTIDLWSKARKIFLESPRGKLVVESSPPDALVYLDGKSMGKTPIILEVPVGSYHLHIQDPELGSFSRLLTVSSVTKRIRVQLDFEGAVDLCQGFPGIRTKTSSSLIHKKWWPWLAARLRVRRTVVVQLRHGAKSSRLAAALVDLERARVIREAWFEIDKDSKSTIEQDSADLAHFLVTGQAAKRMKTRFQLGRNSSERIKAQDDKNIADFETRPWYRTWWTFAIGSGAFLLAAVSSHLASDYYSRQSELSSNAQSRNEALDLSNTWFGLAMGGYASAAAILATGLVLHITYDEDSDDNDKSISLSSSASSTGAFIVLSGRF